MLFLYNNIKYNFIFFHQIVKFVFHYYNFLLFATTFLGLDIKYNPRMAKIL